MPDYLAESCEINNPHDIKPAWEELQERADCSYFQSWGWMSIWLEQIANDLEPVLVKVWYDDLLVGMGIFVTRQLTRHHVFHSNAVFLNEYPFDGRNMVIEYNGLLADKNHKQAAYNKVIKHIFNTFDKSDEFFLSALAEDEDYRLVLESPTNNKSHLKVIEKSLTWSVGLDQFEHGIDGFLNTLSKNRRAQIYRSIKAYEEQGPLRINEASSEQEALLFFDGLKDLHTERWKLKGGTGSFANPLWNKLHRSLITSRFTKGEIQLLCVSNANEVIGYLYNFIWRKRIYVLQTGFKMTDDKKLMPGYVTHALAIVHNKQKGMAIYDLMHGDSLYKKILCNQNQTLYWLVIQRNKLKFFIEDCSRALVQKFKNKN